MNKIALQIGQRVMLTTFLPHMNRPLYAGDIGTVDLDNDGNTAVIFDRYPRIVIAERRTVAGVTQRVVSLCTPVDSDGLRPPVLPDVP